MFDLGQRFELVHLSCLDPLLSDGATDDDGDGVANVHEYFDGELHTADPCSNTSPKKGKKGGGYFGDADGSLSFGVPDLDTLKAQASGRPANYSSVFPPHFLVQDLDGTNSIGVGDLDLLKAIISGRASDYISGSPNALAKVLPSGNPDVVVGDTVALKVTLSKDGTLLRGGFGVVFSVVQGSATLFGGEGDPGAPYPAGSRWDITDLNGQARMTLRADATGPIRVQVQLPYDGVVHTREVTLSPDITITGTSP